MKPHTLADVFPPDSDEGNTTRTDSVAPTEISGTRQTSGTEYRATVRVEVTRARDALFIAELTAKQNADWGLSELCRNNRIAIESILSSPLLKVETK